MTPVAAKLGGVAAGLTATTAWTVLALQALDPGGDHVLTAIAGISIAVLLALYLFLLRAQFANQREFGRLEERTHQHGEALEVNRKTIDDLRAEIADSRHTMRNEMQQMVADFHERLRMFMGPGGRKR